ncbi:hypothetical protein IVB27_37240 [Bradyrhizobium sp. 197]|uniref:hypothetical protein n=1 Tax=Bradyrhizobium sp. 197 TaxID=2782663 RepID=UPI001FF8DBB4|nr:hypothetical protein [Bradyrhizobium sp. 197]MCK1480229.1 hypothetical protein [Bradyrhizobium sp. 197]
MSSVNALSSCAPIARQKFLGCLGRRDGNLSLAAEAGIEIEKIKWFAHFGVAALNLRVGKVGPTTW